MNQVPNDKLTVKESWTSGEISYSKETVDKIENSIKIRFLS
ncbi:pemK-like family protein [Staphylococcus aureus]|nr:pemK-like family protein [Staphylococcus aureus]